MSKSEVVERYSVLATLVFFLAMIESKAREFDPQQSYYTVDILSLPPFYNDIN